MTLEIIILTLYFVCLRGASFVSSSSNLASRQQKQQQLSYAEEAKLEKHKLRFMLPSFTELEEKQEAVHMASASILKIQDDLQLLSELKN